jgi:hypothetical protein
MQKCIYVRTFGRMKVRNKTMMRYAPAMRLAFKLFFELGQIAARERKHNEEGFIDCMRRRMC